MARVRTVIILVTCNDPLQKYQWIDYFVNTFISQNIACGQITNDSYTINSTSEYRDSVNSAALFIDGGNLEYIDYINERAVVYDASDKPIEYHIHMHIVCDLSAQLLAQKIGNFIVSKKCNNRAQDVADIVFSTIKRDIVSFMSNYSALLSSL